MKTSYGIKNPSLEDEQSVKKYLLKQHIDTSNVYVFKDLNSYSAASKMKMLSIPEAMFFNKDGYFVPYKEEAVNCNANVNKFIMDISAFSEKPADETKKMDNLMAIIVSTNNKQPQRADINVFITWAKFAGKLNREKAFDWIDLLQKAKAQGIKVNYYLLNCDFQKSWGIPKDLQEKLGIKS